MLGTRTWLFTHTAVVFYTNRLDGYISKQDSAQVSILFISDDLKLKCIQQRFRNIQNCLLSVAIHEVRCILGSSTLNRCLVDISLCADPDTPFFPVFFWLVLFIKRARQFDLRQFSHTDHAWWVKQFSQQQQQKQKQKEEEKKESIFKRVYFGTFRVSDIKKASPVMVC